MLIEFRVANFRSLRDEQVFSMVADNGKELQETNTFDSGIAKLGRLVASAAIYGPNAAGKTNLLKALQFMQSVVLKSTTAVPTGLTYTPFKLDLLKRDEPSQFEVTFGDCETGSRYQYSFSLDAERIHHERLIEFKARANLIFERTYLPAKKSYKWDFGKSFRGNRTVWRDATRDNALFLSTAVQLNSTQLLPVFNWFQKRLVAIVGDTTFNAALTLKLLNEPNGKERLLPFMREADFSIADVEVQREPISPQQMVPIQPGLPFTMPLVDLGGPNESPTLAKVSFSHRPDDPVQIDLTDESSGTQALFRTAGAWLNVFTNGEVLLVDEIDSSLHPLLVRFLVNLFHSRKSNPCRAQLVCTTHDTSLLNQGLFRRDQVWFVEKSEDYASRCYPLSDFSPRKDEIIEKWYMRGRYGALPILTDIDM
jgi:AAA15 family ATPase/GTPase